MTDLAIGVVILAIVVSIGASILLTVRDNRLTSLPTVTTVNETIQVVDAGTQLTQGYGKSVLTCYNKTSAGVLVPASNYSVTLNGDGLLVISNASKPGPFTTQPWNCTYSRYDISQADYSSANKAAVGIGEYGSWFKIIVIVGISAVVLALIFSAFGRGNAEIGGSY